MPAMTYTSLVARVINYLNRDDDSTAERVPDFISDAQQMLALACKTIGQESYITGVFIPGTSVYQKPANWRRNISMNVGSADDAGVFNVRNPIFLRTYEFVRDYTPDSAAVADRALPQFYADYGFNNFLVAPVPDLAYPFEFCFIGLPEPITPTNQTNWWTNFAPQVLFNAVMSEAMFFLENYEKAAAYDVKTQKGIELVNAQDDMRVVDRSSARQSD
jgi:hypothetical protein